MQNVNKQYKAWEPRYFFKGKSEKNVDLCFTICCVLKRFCLPPAIKIHAVQKKELF